MKELDWISEERRNNYHELIKRNPKISGKMCQAHCDGDCYWEHCPQIADNEPEKSGRHCPLPHWSDQPDY